MNQDSKISASEGAAPDVLVVPEQAGVSDRAFAMMVMDALEQGVVLWSEGGSCIMFNDQAAKLLYLEQGQLVEGTSLRAFMREARDRNGFTNAKMREYLDLFDGGRSFRFDCDLPNGDVLSLNVRPARGGGHVMAITNVTELRRADAALSAAKAEAEEAQRKAQEVLEVERGRQHQGVILAQMDEWLQSCQSLPELFNILETFMKKVMPGSCGQLYIYTRAHDALKLAFAWNTENPPARIQPDSCWALRRGRTYVYEPDRKVSFICDHVKETRCEDTQPEQFTCMPIMAHGETVGMLHTEFIDDTLNQQVHDKHGFMRRCAERVSLAIANVRLREELQDQSTRDPLTGLYNRRHFLDSMKRTLNETSYQQGNFALLSLDADKFKKFNDDHGHDAGDAVLEMIAEKMNAIAVDGAVPCRVGGEEFSVILPHADRTRATAAAEELREAVEAARVKYSGGPLPQVTISVGIAVYPTHGTEIDDLIKQADIALYDAKKAGRNCCKSPNGADLITFD